MQLKLLIGLSDWQTRAQAELQQEMHWSGVTPRQENKGYEGDTVSRPYMQAGPYEEIQSAPS